MWLVNRDLAEPADNQPHDTWIRAESQAKLSFLLQSPGEWCLNSSYHVTVAVVQSSINESSFKNAEHTVWSHWGLLRATEELRCSTSRPLKTAGVYILYCDKILYFYFRRCFKKWLKPWWCNLVSISRDVQVISMYSIFTATCVFNFTTTETSQWKSQLTINIFFCVFVCFYFFTHTLKK